VAGRGGPGTRAWLRCIQRRGGQAESVLAYAAVADLIGDVHPRYWRDCRTCSGSPSTESCSAPAARGPRLINASSPRRSPPSSTAFRGRAVLVAIDDVQWLDPSSQAVVEYAARRLRGRAGMLLTERCDPKQGRAVSGSIWPGPKA